jgi:hypothetical protein
MPFSPHDLGRLFDAGSPIRDRGLMLTGKVDGWLRDDGMAADAAASARTPWRYQR